MSLTVDIFVVRPSSEGAKEILLLKRQGGVGSGAWYLPGGIVEAGEDPIDAVIRETFEETGLKVAGPDILRVWSWHTREGDDAYHATYAAHSLDGEVVISEEHSAFRWMEPAAYAQRFLSTELEAQFPEFAGFYQQVRRNVALLPRWMEGFAAVARLPVEGR